MHEKLATLERCAARGKENYCFAVRSRAEIGRSPIYFYPKTDTPPNNPYEITVIITVAINIPIITAGNAFLNFILSPNKFYHSFYILQVAVYGLLC